MTERQVILEVMFCLWLMAYKQIDKDQFDKINVQEYRKYKLEYISWLNTIKIPRL